MQIETYSKDLEEMDKVTKEEFLAALRRQSSGFSRGVSKYRGVARLVELKLYLHIFFYGDWVPILVQRIYVTLVMLCTHHVC